MKMQMRKVTDENATEADKLLLGMLNEVKEVFDGESLHHIAAMTFAPVDFLDEATRANVEKEKALSGIAFGLMTCEAIAELIERTEILRKEVINSRHIIEDLVKENKKLMQVVDIVCQSGEQK